MIEILIELKRLVFITLIIVIATGSFAQSVSDSDISKMISQMKSDIRGPYQDIRWFCKDGTINAPKVPCGEIGGVQRARYKPEVLELARRNNVYLGQILATTPNGEFWDKANRQSRIKQYQIEKYLKAIDDGWINRKAQFYRGAIQEEDEEEWGVQFFTDLLADKTVLENNYFLVRQAAKDVPHKGDNNQSQEIRSIAKVISDDYTPFVDLRIKIHGQPESSDIQKVQNFKEKYNKAIPAATLANINRLLQLMDAYYSEQDLKSLSKFMKLLPSDHRLKIAFTKLLSTNAQSPLDKNQFKDLAELMLNIRYDISKIGAAKTRLALLDMSVGLEVLVYKNVNNWKPNNLSELLDKTETLAKIAAACGYMELWEWNTTQATFKYDSQESISLENLILLNNIAGRWTEWSANMFTATYDETIDLFSNFESKSHGFLDEKVRASILLPLGASTSKLGELIASEAQFSNQVFNIKDQSQMRGINPGYALGELVVVDGSPDKIEVDKSKIYIFNRPSSDLKPLAGIATVTEGNSVSHVQLLARNLAIPNAVLSKENLASLKAYAGQKVFYAVSNGGTVVMKLATQMNADEKKLFEVKVRKDERITVPIDKINLAQKQILNLRNVRAESSGNLCGPKAANLGELKFLFPEKVVEGLVIPFGIFRDHMDQGIPGRDVTYWEFIEETFDQAKKMKLDQCVDSEIDEFVLYNLEVLRSEIKLIKFKDSFVSDVKSQFTKTFNKSLGSVPVFIRSDTNMEDLKDFTGAGLNLTIFNVVEDKKILQGIRDVWASPFSERSYKWRQSYLLNPEHVFPSILIIPTVDVSASGVLITKGISNSNDNDLTLAFSRGAGGAVDGQAAESYLLHADGTNELLAPAREPYMRKLPDTGGSQIVATTYEQPILRKSQLDQVRQLSKDIKTRFPKGESGFTGPFDIEFGFVQDQLWLFQVRPFVENKNAKGSLYLESITPKLPKSKFISINTSL